jgi:type I restriction enzyme S subunit
VLRGRLDLTEIHQFELFDGELDRLKLAAGDILIVEGNGSPSEIGRCAIWNGEIENCIHQNHIIRVRPVLTNPRFFDFYWNSPLGTARVKEKAASTSGLYTLSVSKIANLPLPLAPLEEQTEIVAQVEAKVSNIAQAETEIKRSLERAARLRQAILKRAFEGRLF